MGIGEGFCLKNPKAIGCTDDTPCKLSLGCSTRQDMRHEDQSLSFEIGDIVELVGASVDTQFKGLSAAVTKVHETHVSAIAIDDRGRGIGECWPNFGDIKLVNKSWRVGEQVMVTGMQSKKR